MKKSKTDFKFIEKETNICVGFSCNNMCLFCCEGKNRDVGDKTTGQIKQDIINAKKRNSRRVIFTGGEPTIRKDIFHLIRFAKDRQFDEIFIISNGRMCSRTGFCKKLAEAGITHILFSLNGSSGKVHDMLTRVPGSFMQIIDGIKNMKEVGSVLIENNTTINKINYKDLPSIAKLLTGLGIDYFEFIFVNPSGFARDNFEEIVPTYMEVAPYIHKAIDIGTESGIKVTAESMPFCYMQGYEKNMTEFYMSPKREKLMPQEEIYDLNESRKKSVKVKGHVCKECRYFLICEGIWKEYAEKNGFGELKPVPGKMLNSMKEVIEEIQD